MVDPECTQCSGVPEHAEARHAVDRLQQGASVGSCKHTAVKPESCWLPLALYTPAAAGGWFDHDALQRPEVRARNLGIFIHIQQAA